MKAFGVLVLFLLAAGCATVPVQSRLVGGEAYDLAGRPRFVTPDNAGQCSATIRVHVVDGAGAPVPGAAVIAIQRVTERADKTVLSQTLYEAGPVMTDAAGNARICDPDTLTPELSGIAARFVDRDKGVIQVFRESAKVELKRPYSRSLNAVLPARF